MLGGSAAYGQVADGNLTGVILDPSGAAVAGAKIEAVSAGTGFKTTAASDSIGKYRFNNLPVGSYNLNVSARGFRDASLSAVQVELSKTTTAHVTLTVGSQTDSITVTEAPTLIDTTTAQIANLFTSRMSSDLAVASNTTGGGYLNLSLLGAGVASSGGLGAGTGPSIGGQRPRNNNFTLEGADNNRKDVTGPLAVIPNDAVQEFTLLQNQFSAEYGHSAAGQFNAVVKSGTNQIHGRLYEYLQNRYLNAQDETFKRQGVSGRARNDSNLFGGNLGGPLKKDKAFYFASLDYNPIGRAATSASARYAPTAAGYELLSSMPQLAQTNLNVLKQYLPAAPQQDGTRSVAVQGQAIPLGITPIIAPAYANAYRGLASLDFNLSQKDQLRGRYVQNTADTIDTGANVPGFWSNRPTRTYLASISELHTFGPTLVNELRASYNRFNDRRNAGGQNFPGLDTFPTLLFPNDLAVQIGPFLDSPQQYRQNTYQLADNVTWTLNRHELKFGFDGRNAISSLLLVPKLRGEYRYNSLNRYLMDLAPDGSGSARAAGGRPYSGNAMSYYLYANDNWKATRRLTLNLGARWEYNGVASGMKEQALNAISDVPGVISFRAPKSQLMNFAPRVGFAYSPGNSGKTSIRGGFGLAYDQIFDNIGNNTSPPQRIAATSAIGMPAGFFASGAIRPVDLASVWTPAQARAATQSWIPDQKLGYAVNWNFGIQHSFLNDYVLDVRYVGTRGVHLLSQMILNRVALVTADRSLPTYLTKPSTQELDSLPLTFDQLASEQAKINPWAAYGFTDSAGVTSYTPQGNSIYHGMAVDLTKRFSGQFMMKLGYTWSHLRDDSTAEINTTALSPRRPQDFADLRSEWASSALDRRHRLTATWVYDTPWFRQARNPFVRNVLGNYSFSGTYTAESPQWVTPQSAQDANMNRDSAGDRVVVNPNGTKGVGSDVTPLMNSAGSLVAYVANNPNAQFIRAGAGVFPNSGRNVLPTQGINNFDMSVSKTFTARERYRTEIRADFYNALNHAQFIPGRTNNIASLTRANENGYLTPGNKDFGAWNRVFSSQPRVIQIVAKFTF